MPVRDNTVYKPNNTDKYRQWFVITIAGKNIEQRYFLFNGITKIDEKEEM